MTQVITILIIVGMVVLVLRLLLFTVIYFMAPEPKKQNEEGK